MTERLRAGFLQDSGSHRVYRVQKEKLTSLEAATELANAVGIPPGEIGMAGLKDRQGVTTQFMSVHRGPAFSGSDHSLSIKDVGFAESEITAGDSDGNDFQIVVRDLYPAELERSHASLEAVREHGLPNYFDSQRFGNLRHGQGWIVLDLIRGDISGALKRLVASASPYEPPARRRLKDALWRSWGDWPACRSIAGKLGRYHSVFEHLKRNGDDFEGAFHRVATRERLIHLFAFQSHLFNRALALWILDNHEDRFSVRGIEGKLRFPNGALDLPPDWEGALMLPGERLEGVSSPEQQWLFGRVLGDIGIEAGSFELPDVPGFQLKPEPRAAAVIPSDLRIRPAEDDPESDGGKMLRVQFGLPKGAYATLVIQRLFGREPSGGRPEGSRDDSPRSSRRGRGRIRGRGPGRGARRGRGSSRKGGRPQR